MVVQPDVLPGFSASVDYYKIEIAGAISTVGTQSVAQPLLRGRGAGILRPDHAGRRQHDHPDKHGTLIGSIVGDLYVNVAAAAVEGIDLETSYHSDVRHLRRRPESISLRVLASWLLTRSDTNSTGA